MPYISHIATAVPAHAINNEEVISYYSSLIKSKGDYSLSKRISTLVSHSYIERRYSCLPDFNSDQFELFTPGSIDPDIGKRLSVYHEKILPLAVDAVNSLLLRSHVDINSITHIITVSCTGMSAPGLEFRLAEHFNILQVEKTALNYMGCYAAIKAIREADYIARALPDAKILIVCAELCSLHFNSSTKMEELIANLLFADGAAAILVMGDKSAASCETPGFHIDATGSAAIPGTMDLMTWNITPSAFRMYLNRKIAESIKENVNKVMRDFIEEDPKEIDNWAIHPGGIRILKAVQDALQLSPEKMAASLEILQLYGNMSSPTVLFILQKIFSRIRKQGGLLRQNKIVACAFGPGINIELLQLSMVPVKHKLNNFTQSHAVTNQVS